MKHLLIILIPFLWGCTTETKHPEQPLENNKVSFQRLLDKYADISFDTLEVHYVTGDEKKSKFFGSQLDSIDIGMLPKRLTGSTGNTTDFFACYKFAIDKSRYGLITRTPSMYLASVLDLLIYDSNADSVIYFSELSQDWGDEGASYYKTSWLFRDKQNILTVFSSEQHNYDHSVENEKDTIVEHVNNYFLFQVKNNLADTIRADSSNITVFEKASH